MRFAMNLRLRPLLMRAMRARGLTMRSASKPPVRRKMSGKAKAAIIVAIIAALVLLVLLGVESMNALGAFLSVAATN